MALPAAGIAARQAGKKIGGKIGGRMGRATAAPSPGKAPEEETPEGAPEEEAGETGAGFSIFEWVIVFFIALIGDIFDLITNIIIVDLGIIGAVIDILLAVIIGGWTFLRVGEVPEKAEAALAERGGGMLKRGWKAFPKKRFALVFGGEFFLGRIPFVDYVLFGWTFYMLSLLKKY